MAKWKLCGPHANFTGVLNGNYIVNNGVVTTNDDLEPRASQVIREFYSATPVTEKDDHGVQTEKGVKAPEEKVVTDAKPVEVEAVVSKPIETKTTKPVKE